LRKSHSPQSHSRIGEMEKKIKPFWTVLRVFNLISNEGVWIKTSMPLAVPSHQTHGLLSPDRGKETCTFRMNQHGLDCSTRLTSGKCAKVGQDTAKICEWSSGTNFLYSGLYSIIKTICIRSYISPPKDGEIALWPSTKGAIPYFLVLLGSELSITEITKYRYFSHQSLAVNLNMKVSKVLYHWILSLNHFSFCETQYLHFTTHVFGHSVISPFLGVCFFSLFLFWVLKPQHNHWTKQVVGTHYVMTWHLRYHASAWQVSPACRPRSFLEKGFRPLCPSFV